MATLSEIAADIYRRVFAAEPNPTQVQAISTWINQERAGLPGGISGGIFANNPLNITLTADEARGDFSDSWIPKGAGGADSSVRAFPTLDRGIAANAKRLWDGHYQDIRIALVKLGNGGALNDFWAALKASPWAGSRYGGVDFNRSYSSLDPVSILWGNTGGLGTGGTGGVKIDPKPGMTDGPSVGLPNKGEGGAVVQGAHQATTQAQETVKSWWDGVTSPWTFFEKLLKDGTNWRRLGLAILGAFLILVGIWLYVRGWMPNISLAVPGVGAISTGKGK